jgi:hypothetical protein
MPSEHATPRPSPTAAPRAPDAPGRALAVALALATTLAVTGLVAGCGGDDATSSGGGSTVGGGDANTGPSPLFYSCQNTAACVADALCVDQGYCKPRCSSDADCTQYPYANLSCRPLGDGSSVCDDQPPHLVGGGQTGGGQTGGGSQTLPNGCSSDYPIACPNNLCCPQQYPVCGGGCGYACCAQGGGTSGGGSQSGSCPGGCGGNQVCVNFSGSGACEPVCSSNAECQSGCCGALQGSSLHACLPANYCSGGGNGGGNGGGGGNACQSANHCISSYGASGPCAGYIGLSNSCGKQVSCHYQLANGQTGCVLPQPGNNDCSIYAPNGVGGTIDCELTDVQACVNAVGCSL